jgi:hypothetical protein
MPQETVRNKIKEIIKSCQIDIGHHRYADMKRKQIRDSCNIDIEDLVVSLRSLMLEMVGEAQPVESVDITLISSVVGYNQAKAEIRKKIDEAFI